MRVASLMCCLLVIIISAPPLASVGIEPVIKTFRQPDGKEFLGRVRGDEYVTFFETAEGYSIAQNAEGFWCYAVAGPEGFLQASPHVAGEANPDLVIGEKHRRHAPHIMNEIQQRRSAHYETLQRLAPAAAKLQKNALSRSRNAVSYKLAVLLVEFPDVPGTYAPQDFEQLLFSEAYTYVSPAPGEPAYGSMRDYYLKMSGGALSISGQVFDWVMADSSKSYYERRANVRFEVLNKSGVNLNEFDGYAIVYAGTVGSSSGNLWPQTFSAGGKLHYVMSEKWLPSYDFAPIGVHCHEFGHLLGLPDLYDTDFSSVGAGRWCTMSTGNYGGGFHERPFHYSAWPKITLGWLTPQTLYDGAHAGLLLPPVESSREVYKLISFASYFLMENRQKLDYDLNLPGVGMLIWHVDERFGSQPVDAHRLLDLEEADGTETGGDAGDPFPGRSSNFTFGAATQPGSRDYNGKSYIEITGITVAAADIRFDADIDLGEGAGITVNEQGNFPNIFSALEAAFPHGRVWVPRGRYFENNLLLKNGVRLLGEHAPATYLDGQGNRLLEARNVAAGEIRHLTLINGAAGVTLLRSPVTIAHNLILNMKVDGIVCYESAADIRNNTIINAASSGIACLDRAFPTIRNNILSYNGAGIAKVSEAAPVLSYNDIWNNGSNYQGLAPGNNDISSNPQFVNPFFGDYRLRAVSPCIDAGDPALRDPDSSRSDIGALPFDPGSLPPETELRLNAGGNAYLAADSAWWRHDGLYFPGGAGFIGGHVDSTADMIAQTGDDYLYQTARLGMEACLIDLPNGRYLVRLHFAEIALHAPRQRVFNVSLEGSSFLEGYDIYALAGHDAAISEAALVEVVDGQLAVVFTAAAGEPLLSAIEVLPANPWFIDVANYAKAADPGAGLGVALGDYNGDGATDIFVVNAAKTSTLLENNGFGAFINRTQASGLAAADACEAGVWGDYDNDGWLDLYLVRNSKPGLLYRNRGDGTFVDVAAAAGVTNDGAGQSAAWADFDNDGHLDLFVANAGASRLYRNNGNGTFTDLAAAAGLGHAAPSTGGLWGDFNGDGYPDLLVTNRDNALPVSNLLYWNNGNRTFTAMPLGMNGLGAAAADYDNDGDLDVFIISVIGSLGLGEHLLFRNDGAGVFTNVADSAGLAFEGLARSAAWGDFDNDGWLDLHLAGVSRNHQIFKNNGDGTFADFSDSAGVYGQSFVKTSAWGDFDRDGALDIYVVNGDYPNVLYQNQRRNRNWLTLKLQGRNSNRAALGARAQLIAGGLSQWREISGGSGFRSQNSLEMEFGLGQSEKVDTLRVYWPSGLIDRFTDLHSLNRVFTVVEGTTTAVAAPMPAQTLPTAFALEQNFPNPVQHARPGAPATKFRYALPRAARVSLRIYNLLGQEVIVLADGYREAGWHTVFWDGANRLGASVRPGIYFCQLRAENYVRRRKIIVLP